MNKQQPPMIRLKKLNLGKINSKEDCSLKVCQRAGLPLGLRRGLANDTLCGTVPPKKRTKKSVSAFLFFAILWSLSIVNLQAQTVLTTEDFDGGGIGFTTTSAFNNGTGNNHFNDTDGSDISNVSGAYSFVGGGNIFWAAENTDDPAGTGFPEQRLTTNNFSIDGFENIKVCIDMAAGNEQLGNLGTYDDDDYVQVQFNTDIQPLYRDMINFSWLPNEFNPSDVTNQPFHHDPNRDGDGSDGVQLTTTAQNFCYIIPNSFTSDVNATMMSVRVLVRLDANSEEIAFDNIEVTAADVTPPTVTCSEFTGSGNSCPNFHDPNTPNGTWQTVPTSGMFTSVVGGGVATGTVDLNGCVTDDITPLDELEYTVLASYVENNIPGCSKDIINEYQIRDAAGNISPTTFIFRGTITYSGPIPTITCPPNATVDCGDSSDPSATGMATATSGCGTPAVTYEDAVHGAGGSCPAILRTWTATDGCGQTSACTQEISFNDVSPPTSSCAEPIEIYADFCPESIGPGTPNGGWGNIPASGIIQLQVGPVHVVDLNCLMDDVSSVGDLEIRLASAQFIGSPTSCLRVIESVYDIRDAAGNIAPSLVTVHFTLENDDPITQIPSAGITCGETFTMQSQLDYIYTVEPPSNGVSGNQDCRSALIWRTPNFETACGDFTDFSISFSAESSPAPNDFPENMIFGGTSGNPVPVFPYIPPSQYFHGSSESCSATTRVTYNLTDECGKTFTCFFLIEVEDNQPPIPACNDIEVQLVDGMYTLTPADEAAIGGGSMDNCGIDPSLSGILPTTFTRTDIGENLVTYNVTDNCGNTAACVATVTVTCPLILDCSLISDQALECRSDLPPVDFDLVTAIDSCGDLVKSALTIIPGNDGCPGNPVVITREYFVNDGINSESCMQTFTVESTIPPTISCPPNVTVSCSDDNSPVNTGMATGTASCANFSLDIDFEDVSTQGISGCSQFEYTITRTWTATDQCGREVSCDQIITVEDRTAPVITCIPDVTIECDVDPTALNTAANFVALGGTISDNCTTDITEFTATSSDVSTQGTAGCSQFEYTITRTWTVSDACGNASTCVQTINVEDTTAPVITCIPDATIECDADPSAVNTAASFVSLGGTISDNCTTDITEFTATSSDVSTQGVSGCSQYEYTITRTWTVSDACGNTSTCVQTINVEDTTAPVITCPANQTLVCNTDPLPSATEITDFLSIGGTASDNCSANSELTVSFVDNPTNQSLLNFCSANPADRTLVRTYTVSDACGNPTTCTQNFVYNQSVLDPVIVSVPADQTVDCAVNAFPQPHLFVVETDCGLAQTETVSTPISNGTPGCPGSSIRYTYTSTDLCGRSVSHTQVYTLNNEGPEFVCPPDICVIDCPADTDMIQSQFDNYANLATVISSCSETTVSITNNFSPNGFIPQNCLNPVVAIDNTVAYQIVQFTATDACGRNTSCTAMVVIQDVDAPEITVAPTDAIRYMSPTATTEYQDWANGMISNVVAADDCNNHGAGNITWSYSPAVPNTVFLGPFATTQVTFTATDDCGNGAAVTVTYRLKEPPTTTQATITGNILTEDDEAIELVSVSLEGTGMNTYSMTDEAGYFGFEAEMNQNYEVAPESNDDYLNGITTLDLILLGQHILEFQTLDSPYKMIAADINRSGAITSLDMIELRRLILMIDSEFSNNTSWRFVDAEYVFPNPLNPFASTFPEVNNINNLSEEAITDFIGVKVGDLNGSATPNQLANNGDTRSRETLNFATTDQALKAGETYTVDFRASDFKEMMGYQFTLEYDASALTFFDFNKGKLSNLDMRNFGIHLNDGALTCSWNERAAVTVKDEEVLFSLAFTALKDGQLSELIFLNSKLTKAEAYDETIVPMNLELTFAKPNSDRLILDQNQPNPFRMETMIGFSIPEAGPATLTIFDVSGQVVKVIEGNYDVGYHTVNISRNDLGENGIWFYRLKATGKKAITKKMIVLE